MSNLSKKKSPVKAKISTAKSENNLSEIFEFYARIVKLIILRKDDADVVSKYSTWLAALRKHPDDRIRCDYVRLLLAGLDLNGGGGGMGAAWPFDDYPPDAIVPVNGDWITTARTMFRHGEEDARTVHPPPVVTAVSDDKCEFAACQTVPGAGLQCYYARSDRPLHEWHFKFGSPSAPPGDMPEAVHAVSTEWERSLAGIHRARDEPLVTRKFAINVDHCRILNTFQEILNLGVAKFKWYDKSLLTGDIIPGSDLCIDWSIHEHEKTQLEIDEETVRSFDKLYPDNFRLVTKPEFLEGIVKKMEGAEKNAQIMAKECERLQQEKCAPRQFAGKDRAVQYSAASSGKTDKSHPDENSMSTTKRSYREPPAKAPEQSYVLDAKPFDRKREDCLIPRPIIEHRVYDDDGNANERLAELPSFTKVGDSFNSIVNEAENIIRGVNDWLATKELI